MKRKVIQIGEFTKVISLPSGWSNRHNLRKGDEIEVEEKGNKIVISNNKDLEPRSAEKNMDNLSRFGKSFITSAYRVGFNDIKINYSDPSYASIIQEVLSRQISGFEIIKQSDSSITMKEMSKAEQDAFDIGFRRLWMLLIDFAEDSFSSISQKRPIDYKSIQIKDMNINKFANYCIRILVQKGHFNDNRDMALFHLIKELEEIGDYIKRVMEIYNSKKFKYNKELFDTTLESLKKFHDAFYEYKDIKIEELFNNTKQIEKIINTSSASVNKDISMILYSLNQEIRKLLSTLIEIDLFKEP